ncbi:T9SS type A sorting domain-containing protein [Hymenobacter cellulosilyticus]|uniref:T9SS type A sorting domain-containing protein n=1 Tax=Hymenobacter cellulosilyticus TaxID=2932248 RepID=A0A8T9QFM0_9BACT|nr:T9SS type A sorting domain-containing protein [Hymenobacter cellulosilyticus]UOQ73633.1 T9SS type A sorting domain-containing protein [Hymenobacter cellulosilyticus]
MKKLIYASLGLVLCMGAGPEAAAQAVADPTLGPVTVLQSGIVNNVQQQPDGKYLVGGYFTQVNGTAATGLVRLNADGSLDNAFTSTANNRYPINKIRLLPNGQILLQAYGAITVGGRNFITIAKLNADGSPVTSFSVGSGAPSVSTMEVQADGKILVGGDFTTFNGVTANGLVRLNADGSIDQAFSTALNGGFTRTSSNQATVRSVAVQPDGKILVAGNFDNYNNTGRKGLVRLNANGSLDTSFTPAITTNNTDSEVLAVALDPRTNYVLAFRSGFSVQQILRMTTTGALDNTFTTQSTFNCLSYSSTNSEEFAVDSNGRVIVSGCFVNYGGVASGNNFVTRFLSNGQRDTQFAVGQQLDSRATCVKVLANDDVLLGGEFSRYGSIRNVNLVRLNSAAQALATPRPALMADGAVEDVVQQPDGKLLVGGKFWQINGQAAGNIARLNLDGTLDNSFQLNGVDGQVRKIAVRDNGRIVVAGDFTTVGTQASPMVAQLLANGSPDASFATAGTATSAGAYTSNVHALALQADGSLLIGGPSTTLGNFYGPLHRVLTNGAVDAAYSNQIGQFPEVLSLAALPSGKHYVGFRGSSPAALVRLNANGSLDNTFTAGTSTGYVVINDLVVLPNEKVLAGGSFSNYGGTARTNLVQLNANGTVDAAFVPPVLSGTGITSLARYANGRILIGGGSLSVDGISRGTVARLNPNGSYDASFSSTLRSGYNAYVTLQADESALVYSTSLYFGSTPNQTLPLVRLTAPNVLSVSSRQSTARTEAWPVPAHSELHVQVEAAAQPRSLELLDATGRVVLSRAIREAEPVVPVSQLRAGLYLLRVNYANGSVTRPVAVE